MRKVLFEFDKSHLTSEARDTLEDNATWLRDHSGVKVRIEGHADERGSVEYNLALGERRAMRVRSYLISLGIDSSRIFTISFGEERPKARGHNERAWAKNRRAEFKVAQ
ncbi:MAG: peptidoglycan-associated lipoprotein Pal [bacterium]|nr:peptidoglycan-associated lipoprotein Pal [bacterium]